MPGGGRAGLAATAIYRRSKTPALQGDWHQYKLWRILQRYLIL